jgi:hypothetical protein
LEHWLKHEPIRAHRTGPLTRWRKWARRNPSAAALVGLFVALSIASGMTAWKRASAVPMSKSIAVLPFENLSREPDSVFFADGVQDEILTNLARIADLKVIGRTSVMQYKSGVARDLRRIGQQLASLPCWKEASNALGNTRPSVSTRS